MIGRPRYRGMLQALDCCGLSPHARGPPQWAEVHDVHPGQFSRPAIRSRAGGGTTGPAKKPSRPNHTYGRYGMNHGTSQPAIRKGPGDDLVGETARPGFLLRWRPAGGR
jgi:hypothetical protein